MDIKVGDKVKIIDNGMIYPVYTDFFCPNKCGNLLGKYLFAYGQNFSNGTECEVLFVGENVHGITEKIAVIKPENYDKITLIGINGIERVDFELSKIFTTKIRIKANGNIYYAKAINNKDAALFWFKEEEHTRTEADFSYSKNRIEEYVNEGKWEVVTTNN